MEQTQSIVNDLGIELLVTYKTEVETHTEECHGIHHMSEALVEITYVELAICGSTIYFHNERGNRRANILPLLTEKQISHIKDQLYIH